jgi:hypothetical protein
MHHQVDSFFEGRFLGEIVDVVPAVNQSTDVTDHIARLSIVEKDIP